VTRPAVALGLPDREPNPLIALFRQCVVRVGDEAGSFRGTGFFVAPGLVLTCAHVVHGAAGLRVRWRDRTVAVGVVRAEPPLESVPDPADYPLPDLAVLEVEGAQAWGHPCAGMTTEPPALSGSPDALYLAGYTVEHGPDPALTGATTEFESLVSEGAHEFYKLKRGQVLPGFSGSPLLNTRIGLVAAIVESSRGRHADLGGFAVPVSELARAFPEVFEASQRHHGDGAASGWKVAVEAERTLAAARDGRRGRVPLRRPVVPLEQGADVSPSTLLRPRHAVVSYIGREQLLGDLADWCETEHAGPGPELWLCTGPGGYGKTRLAVQACAEAESRGWTAGLLRPEIDDIGRRELAEWPGRLLIAIDYAETRPATVGRLVEEFTARAPRPPVRIMLLVRRRGTRPDLLAMFNEQRDEELAALLRRAPLSRLDDSTAEVDRRRLFDQAVSDFGAHVAVPATERARPDLLAAHFARPLYVLVAALLTLASPATDVDTLSERDLLRGLLTDHESRYWERWDKQRELGLDPDDQWTAVGLATLLTAVGDAEAMTVARLIPHHREEPESRLISIARWLAQLYPATAAAGQINIGPLEPDRLGEVLIADMLRQHPDLLATALDAASDRQVTQALTIVGRIAHVDQDIRDQLRVGLDARMPELLQRGMNARR
jgi:S1-C subfamily serine protease